jgi:hypothetical protein
MQVQRAVLLALFELRSSACAVVRAWGTGGCAYVIWEASNTGAVMLCCLSLFAIPAGIVVVAAAGKSPKLCSTTCQSSYLLQPFVSTLLPLLSIPLTCRHCCCGSRWQLSRVIARLPARRLPYCSSSDGSRPKLRSTLSIQQLPAS